MTNGDWALLISGVSLAISAAGFIWGIYEKFIFVRPRLQVGFAIMTTFPGPKVKLAVLSVTNMGPGPGIIYSCVARVRQPWSWRKPWKVRFQNGILNPIDGDPTALKPASRGPFSAGLPKKIDAAETATFYFPFSRGCFLQEPLADVGVTDTYNRFHWCKRANLKDARRKYAEEFQNASDIQVAGG